ncbi:phytanoyl-CoA dioxygenase family protein [Nocardia abscessus]|uniref:phytanoyl-CoA dioxygenase family protein n=1 Tax=Nocardia abscessus TaxID=120957 RepID=UPI0018952BD4|nr:phytanoyl-CoA dioxygenase family protein [Nocardia abscessus]MBF6216526.1 phytanoyl-CoA dioxygenase family protein [Nocardia abscessus]
MTSELAETYRRDGYLVVRGALSQEETHRFQSAVDSWLRQRRSTGDSYEVILQQDHLAWRRGGPLAALTRHARLAALASAISGLSSVRIFLDQIIVKPPGGAPTIPHQDAPFLSFDDHRSLNCWIALDEVDTENGVLGYYRGSHLLGPLPRAHLDEPDVLEAQVPALSRLPVDVVPMRPGDVAFHNCLTVHRGYPNKTSRPRRAFSIQYMPALASYNGYEHEFLTPYRPVPGQTLDFPCFAIPETVGAT